MLFLMFKLQGWAPYPLIWENVRLQTLIGALLLLLLLSPADFSQRKGLTLQHPSHEPGRAAAGPFQMPSLFSSLEGSLIILLQEMSYGLLDSSSLLELLVPPFPHQAFYFGEEFNHPPMYFLKSFQIEGTVGN